MNYFGGILRVCLLFFTQCSYYVGKWEIFNIVNEGVNSKI